MATHSRILIYKTMKTPIMLGTRLQLSPRTVVGRTFVCSLFTIFTDLRVDKESKEVFSNLMTFTEKLEGGLQEDTSLDSLLCKHKRLTNEGLMALEAQRKTKKKQEQKEIIEESKRVTTQEMARGFSLFEEVLLVGIGPKVEWYTKVATATQNAV